MSDNEIKQDIERFEEDTCQSSTYETNGFICYDFELIESVKTKSDPLTFQTVIAYVKEYSGSSEPQSIASIVIDVVDKENSWSIASESMIDSFSSKSESQQTGFMLSDVMNTFTINQRSTGYTSLSNLPTLEYYYYVEPVPELSYNLDTGM